MKFSKPKQVPPGVYSASFVGVRDWESDDDKGYGPAVLWEWEIVSGPLTGEMAGRVTGKKMTPKSALGRLVAAIAGKPLSECEEFDAETIEGELMQIVVEHTEDGSARVANVFRSQQKEEK